ncbi:DinB family protein [Caldibacillus lycopersici]|uniref:DinB family protein n=1 Tax=Perspicuibacillus lycopersici TaxID=1325689 RepID=A0AAE3IYL0_9BACI|nr:DinB family protein [Perspicuibacillus lycopersici]MCU9614430.1 DinB family protein [Perspicuibacillus lycopersici]
MEKTIFHHMDTVRGITEQTIQRIGEQIADVVPDGFNNNIRWNLGHIPVVQEALVFGTLGEKQALPEAFSEYFRPGSKPADWTSEPPTLEEIATVLSNQKLRIREALQGRLEETLPKPFTLPAGITFQTVSETLLFSCVHEGFHIEAIKRIYRFAKRQK